MFLCFCHFQYIYHGYTTHSYRFTSISKFTDFVNFLFLSHYMLKSCNSFCSHWAPRPKCRKENAVLLLIWKGAWNLYSPASQVTLSTKGKLISNTTTTITTTTITVITRRTKEAMIKKLLNKNSAPLSLFSFFFSILPSRHQIDFYLDPVPILSTCLPMYIKESYMIDI